MDRPELLEKLNKATDVAASFAIQRGSPLRVSAKSVLIGNLSVEKNDSGSYNVVGIDKKILFKDISVFDVAIIIAQRYHQHEIGVIKQVLMLEDKFLKYHTDMVHYLHCMRAAKKKQDIDRLAILEDKFQLAEQRAKDTRDSISVFKRVK